MKIAEKIRFLRKESGKSQNDFSVSLNIPRYIVANWEQGRSEPNIEDLRKIADFFETTVDYLIGRSDDFGNITVISDSTLSERETRLLKTFSSLPEIIQDKLIADAEFYAERNNVEKIRKL